MFNGCTFKLWSDIQPSKVQQYLNDLRQGKNGISAQTFNFYLNAVKQFCKWMVQDQRASESPLNHLKGLNVRTDRRHDRRALEPKEIRRLLESTRKAPERFGMTGYQRAMLYRLAIETGLRASELKSLRVSSFNLKSCFVIVEAGYTKNRRKCTLPLRENTAEEFKHFLKGKMPNVQVFNIPDKPAKMIQADLADTEVKDDSGNVILKAIPYVDGTGRYVDFHALRHTAGSLLAASGAHPKVVQSIMRHSDINLTMSRYTHIFSGQESKAVENLPDLSLPSEEVLKATGTNGKAEPALTNQLTKKSCSDSDSMSLVGSNPEQTKLSSGGNSRGHNSLNMADLGTKKEPMSTPDMDSKSTTPGRTRTCDLRFRKPMLYPPELLARRILFIKLYAWIFHLSRL